MKIKTKQIAEFALLISLSLVLGLADRAVPLSAFLGGAVPGIRLGLANTVLLYSVYLMNWKDSLLLMLTKVILSGLIFGSLSAIWFSLAGGLLSLVVMLLARRKPGIAILCMGAFAVAAEGILLRTRQLIRGEVLVFALLIAAGAVACFTLWLLLKRGKLCHIQATSISGAVAHNIGQVIAAMFVVRTPMLLGTYLPVLIGVGMLVGSLTGIVTDRVLRSMHLTAE